MAYCNPRLKSLKVSIPSKLTSGMLSLIISPLAEVFNARFLHLDSGLRLDGQDAN